MKRCFFFGLLALAALATTSPTFGEENRIWTGTDTTYPQDFSLSTNWNTGSPDGNRLFINTETGNYPIYDGVTPVTAWDLFVGCNGSLIDGNWPVSTGNGKLEQTGGTLSVTYQVGIGRTGLTGTYTATNNSTLSLSNELYVGHGGTAVVNLTDSSIVQPDHNGWGSMQIGWATGGSADVTMNGSSALTGPADLYNYFMLGGSNGTATLTMHDGSAITSFSDVILGGHGTATVTMDGYSHFDNIGNLRLGQSNWEASGGATNLTLTLSNGAYTHSTGETLIGSGVGTLATVALYNMSSMTCDSNMRVGYDGGNGTLTIDNSYVTVDDWMQVGHGDSVTGGTGAVVVNGGTFTKNATAETWLSIGHNNSTGSWTQNGGTTTIGTGVGIGAYGATGTLTLNDGTFSTGQIKAGFTADPTAKMRIVFNGGTLQLNQMAHSSFIMTSDKGLFIDPKSSTDATIVVKSGGAKIDSNGGNITIGMPLLKDDLSPNGGLTKNGSGKLSLSGASTYEGNTLVNAGTLALMAPGSLATPRVDVVSGATLESGIGAGAGFNLETLNFDSYSTVQLDIAPTAAATDTIHVNRNAGALSLAGGTGIVNVVVAPLGRGIDSNSYTLFNADSITGTVANLYVTVPGTRATATATVGVNNVVLSIAQNSKTLTWASSSGSAWAVGDVSNNWTDGTNSENFYDLDTVNFTDAATVKTVTITGTVHPIDIDVTNSAGNDYSFDGTGNITGIGTTLTKNGAGKLTLSNTGSSNFTGNVTINAGAVEISGDNQLGTTNTVYVKNSSTLSSTGSWNMGNGVTQHLDISGTAVVSTPGYTGFGNNGGYSEVTMTGGELKPGTAWTDFGYAGKAKLTMSGSSKISLNTGNYGIQFGTNVSDPANTTTIEMNDDAKIAGYSFPASNTNNVFRLGYNGYGTMVMNDRSILDVNRIYMATTGASYAKIELNDEATITTHSTSQVGFGGTGHGEIIISGLPRVALNSGGRLDVGVTGTGSYGKIDVSGTGVKVVGTQMRVGYGESNIGIFTLNAGTEGTFTRVRAGEFGGLNGSGTITVNDAKLTTTQYLEIGYNWDNFPTEQGTNTLEVNGASSVVTCTKSSTSTWGLGIGIEGGKGTVTLNAGLITSPVDTVIVGQCDIRDTANWSTGYATINLNGGVISAPGFLTDAAAPTPTEHDAAVGVINFNGGTVKALASNPAFIAIDDATKGSLTLNVQKNATTGLGAVIDTDTFNIGFALPLQHDSTVGAIDGGLKKLGTGTLTLTGAIGYTGPTVVDSGVLQIANGLTSNLTTVSGNGSMHVADGSTLNATSIVLDTLTIGGPATAASASMTAVPEPGTFVLLALAGIGAVLAWRRK